MSGDSEQKRVLHERANDLEQALGARLPDGVLLSDLSWEVGEAKVINHGLGRLPKGWIISRPRIGHVLPLEQGRTADTLTIAALGSGTLDLWVF